MRSHPGHTVQRYRHSLLDNQSFRRAANGQNGIGEISLDRFVRFEASFPVGLQPHYFVPTRGGAE